MRTSIALCCANCIVFWSCSLAWKKHKIWYKPSDNFFYILLLCTGMDEARALVRALWNSSVSRVSILCSMFRWLDGVAQRRRAYANNAMVLYKKNSSIANSKQQARSCTRYARKSRIFRLINIFVCDDHSSYLQLQVYTQTCNDVTTRSLLYYIVLYIAAR